jgi:hypothetical protein
MKLASIEKIIALHPIEGADLIETATVLGWNVVVKKGEYKIGDLAIYIQIDTIVPEKPEFEFLRQRDFRVRTIKLKGQISQGLLVPAPNGNFKEGEDVTDIIGVKKYNKPESELKKKEIKISKSVIGKIWQKILFKYLFKLFPSLEDNFYPPVRKNFPSHLVSKTDEDRIQNMPYVLEKYKGKQFIISEKLDGSSITIINDKKLRVCSRNNEIIDKNSEYWKVVIDTGFDSYIKQLVNEFNTDNIIVQGEYIGRPQGNKYKLLKNEIRLFNIYVNGMRINQNVFYSICHKYNIPCCPLIDTIFMNHSLQEILLMSEAKSKLNNNTEREGLVFRCVEDNLSFKAISNKFLLKNNE